MPAGQGSTAAASPDPPSRGGAPHPLGCNGLWGPMLPQPLSPSRRPGASSPAHAVAVPGITDSWAMSQVLAPAPQLGFSDSHLCASSRARAHSTEEGRRTLKLRELRISPTSSRSPPTGTRDQRRSSPCWRAGVGLSGTLLLLAPSTWSQASTGRGQGSWYCRKPEDSPGFEEWRGPRFRAYESELHTCS